VTADLRVRLGDREWVFDASRPRSIGRLAGSDICIENPSVSRRHGELRPTASGWSFHDLGSRRGSFVEERQVNEFPITAPVSLRLGGDDGELLNIEPVAVRAPPGITAAPVSRVLRSAMIQPSSVYQPDKPVLRVGRTLDNDIVVDDMLVSRHRAELRIGSDACEVVDLHSQNGTFVDGIRVFRAPVTGTSTIGIGHHRFRVVASDSGTTLEAYVDTGRVAFDAVGLGFTVAGGRKILSG
jgi:pSer/pThr/pTyr-binding forkhead associated (FHA) protein